MNNVAKVADILDERADQHFRCQHTFLMYRNELLVHDWGNVEHIENHWKPLREDYGLPTPVQTKRQSGPSVQLDELPLSRYGAELVVDRYWTDIRLLGYQAEVKNYLKRLREKTPE